MGSANRFGDEAHGYRISPSQQVPRFVTASAKALMLLLFFPQPPHVIFAIRTATTSLRLKARKRYGVRTSCPSASMIRLSLPARTLSDQHTILRLPARISCGDGTSCPNTPNPRPAPVTHLGPTQQTGCRRGSCFGTARVGLQRHNRGPHQSPV